MALTIHTTESSIASGRTFSGTGMSVPSTPIASRNKHTRTTPRSRKQATINWINFPLALLDFLGDCRYSNLLPPILTSFYGRKELREEVYMVRSTPFSMPVPNQRIRPNLSGGGLLAQFDVRHGAVNLFADAIEPVGGWIDSGHQSRPFCQAESDAIVHSLTMRCRPQLPERAARVINREIAPRASIRGACMVWVSWGFLNSCKS